MINWSVCFYCGKKMTEEDKKFWGPPTCCSGSGCGCMGLPTEPPCCVACGQEDLSDTERN